MVRIRIITLRINAREISIPSKENNPIKEPSVIPRPPGINDMAPIITDDEQIEIVFKILTDSIPNESRMKCTATDIIIQYRTDNPNEIDEICGVVEFRTIS